MNSSSRPTGLSGSQRASLGPGKYNRVLSGSSSSNSIGNANPPQEQPSIPAKTRAPTKQNSIKTTPIGARKSDLHNGKADPLSSGKSNCPPMKETRAGLTKASPRLADRSKAFAALQISPPLAPGSHFSWVPLNMNCDRDHLKSTGARDPSLWRRGPANPSGVVIDLSDRPLLCMSVRGTEAAIGCADHSVYVVDVHTQKFQRNLFGKQYGHVDWVTCVDFVEDGRIVSGGMDNKLCLWDAKGVRCTNLQGHTASVSNVKVIDSRHALSASYDKTLLLWDLNGPQKSKPVGCLQGHKGAVLCFAVNSEGGIVSGSREGEVFLWDGRDGKPVLRCNGAHDGHVTAVESLSIAADADEQMNDSQSLFLTGGQDGVLRVWDKRTKAPVQTIALSRCSPLPSENSWQC